MFSCKREGCTNSAATNFDKKANSDNGSCLYPSDAYVGSYTMTDTADNYSGGPTAFTYQLVILRNGNNQIQLSNLFNWSFTPLANVDDAVSLLMIPTGALSVGSGKLNGNKLRLTYTLSGWTIHGTGRKKLDRFIVYSL